jgi:hypothetical protein
MFFHDKPGWSIALRIVLVLVLIGGMVWITRAAFYQGVAVGAGKVGPGYRMFSGDDDMMNFENQDGYHGEYMNSGNMLFHHPGAVRPYSGFAGPMGYHAGGGFATGAFHVIFGILGFFLLVKLIVGFGGMGMYRYGPMGWGPGGRGYHTGHHRHHDGHCSCCAGEHDEAGAPEKAPEGKSKKKSA